MAYETYGARVRAYRELRGMSQEALAGQAKLPPSSLNRIEHDSRKLSLDEAVRLSEVLRVSLAQLAGVDDTVFPVLTETFTLLSQHVHQGQASLVDLTATFQALESLLVV